MEEFLKWYYFKVKAVHFITYEQSVTIKETYYNYPHGSI
jgi:hypothetical protein